MSLYDILDRNGSQFSQDEFVWSQIIQSIIQSTGHHIMVHSVKYYKSVPIKQLQGTQNCIRL